jgi:hypothetical protein
VITAIFILGLGLHRAIEKYCQIDLSINFEFGDLIQPLISMLVHSVSRKTNGERHGSINIRYLGSIQGLCDRLALRLPRIRVWLPLQETITLLPARRNTQHITQPTQGLFNESNRTVRN